MVRSPNKKVVHEIACPPGAIEWHVNFADPHLFFAYGGPLFAQDEIQVAGHPILGSLREALQAYWATALTVEQGRPTPVLVAGVERRCHVATDPNPAEGRPRGLYGNEFCRAPAEVVRRATKRIEPATTTNIIAMAAPPGGSGPYSREQIAHVLKMAWTGFRSAVHESGAGPVAIHTGFWGCGAFGGNRVLMAMLQGSRLPLPASSGSSSTRPVNREPPPSAPPCGRSGKTLAARRSAPPTWFVGPPRWVSSGARATGTNRYRAPTAAGSAT